MGENESQTFVERMLAEIDARRDVLRALHEINRILDMQISESEKINLLGKYLKEVGLR